MSTANAITRGIQDPPELNRGVERTEPEKTQLLVDWISFTLPLAKWSRCPIHHGPDRPEDQCGGDHRTREQHEEDEAWAVAHWLGLPKEDWQLGGRRYFYEKRLSQRHYDVLFAGAQPGMGVHVQITGQGCRALEEVGRVKDWEVFLEEIRAVRGKISRLDTALDDRAGILDMKTIYEAGKAGHVTSRYRGMQPVLPKIAFGAGNGTDERPETLYFGDPRQGESGIRIYDKRVERMAKGYEDPGPWIRVELVVKDDQARSLAKEIGARGFVPAVTGAIREKLDFKEPGTDSNKRRWASASWWAQALGTAEKLALSAKSVARTITEHMQWLETQVARILAKVNMAHDNAPSILNYLLMRGQEKLKPTDRQQIKDYMAIWQTLSQRARAST